MLFTTALLKIGMVTPVNPKVPSTGEPPEPDPGMLPPGPRRTTGGGSKPAFNLGQRTGRQPKQPEKVV